MTYQHLWTAFSASSLALALAACGGGPGETELAAQPADDPGAGAFVPNSTEQDPALQPADAGDLCSSLCQSAEAAACGLGTACEQRCNADLIAQRCALELSTFFQCALLVGYCPTELTGDLVLDELVLERCFIELVTFAECADDPVPAD